MQVEPVAGRLSGRWRRSLNVLVPEASAIGMIAVIRSLGRAGYQVHACSNDRHALGLRSRYAGRSAVHPDYDDPQFLDWLARYIVQHDIAAIVPSESFLHTIRPVFSTYAPLMPLSRDEQTVYRALSKCDVHAALCDAADAKLDERMPPSLIIHDTDALPTRDMIARLSLPIFIKCDAGNGLREQRSTVTRALTHDEAMAAILRLRRDYSTVLVQGYVPGSRVVADFCVWNDEIITRSMMIARHETPHYGGISTLRSIWWDQDIWDDAAARLRQLNWNGCAMMEYRRDPTTRDYYFIEINARYWTGLHTEIYAGIDIPRIQMDAFFGRHRSGPCPAGQPVWCRYTVPGEIGYVLSIVKDGALPLSRKFWALFEFVLLTLHPRVRSDLNFPGDRLLYFLAWYRFLRQSFVGVLTKIPRWTGSAPTGRPEASDRGPHGLN